MNAERWQKVSALLDQALEMPVPERTSFLRKLRNEDASLFKEVESLLDQDNPNSLLNKPPEELLEELQPTVIGNPATDPSYTGSSALPRHAGRYVIQEEIARGGMGAILRAVDADFDRTLAVKILLADARLDPDAERRFLQEAKITGRLQHPGIPPIHELGRLDDGRPFFAMKLIEGQTLTTLISQSQQRDGRFIGIFEQICRTLAYAHSQHIIHRDLKPSNVMVGAFGEVQVMDWGLAKEMRNADFGLRNENPSSQSAICNPQSEMTQQGNILGTPAFMAPEQARGEIDSLDERCDVFGLGGVLCAILAGRAPFGGAETMQVIGKAAAGDIEEAFKALDTCGGEGELVDIAKKCLAPLKEERYRHGGEVADAVTRYRETAQEKLKQAELAREKAQVQAAEERRRRRLTLTLAASVLILILGVAGAGLWYQQYRTQQQAQEKTLNDLVSQSLDDAERERGELAQRLIDAKQVRPLLNDLRLWRDAIARSQAAWQRANGLAESQADKLHPPMRERLQAVQTSLRDDEENWKFASKLQALDAENAVSAGGKYEWFRAAPKFVAAFKEKGWDVKDGDPAEIAERISKSPIKFAVVDALDSLAVLTSSEPANRLLDIARRADPDPWRDRVRRHQPEEQVLTYHLAQLATLDYATQPPQHLRILAMRISKAGGDGAAVARKALVHHPAEFSLHFWLSTQGNDPKEKISHCRAALALRPTSGIAHSWLGSLLGASGDLPDALEHCKKGVEFAPNEAYPHHMLGYVLSKSGDAKGAVAEYKEAIRLDPQDADFYRSLSLAYRQLDDEKAADEALEHSQKLRAQTGSGTPIKTDLSALRKGVSGKLTKDLPVDLDADGHGYHQAYAVTLEEGKHYQIDLAGNYDTLLRVQDAKRRTVVFNDDMAQPANLNSRLVFSPTVTGVYYLVATSFPPDTVGDYRLSVQEVKLVEKPVVITGKLVESTELIKDKHFVQHPMTLSAERRYVIELKSSAFQTHLVLGGLAENDGIVPGNNRHARIDFTPPKTGEYIVGVTSRRPGQTGAYTITVKEFAAPK